ncbi:GNAT family N-acetyltransferase [Sphingomonas daechungensis]|uniref:GNAT family N-acetyltransferase n=1 Tax=Sphingomonas daechungensis TaxID=1176646 RepID=A0ABX6T432_9SPHN|nr:GNAT family N-acetyltransferase [Sphingomonas daechungensis]QNP44221.1 GNAT family N-acetyltransferase [Sphingomonas daechungensis]
MIIRLPRPDDKRQWLALWDGYNRFYERHGPTALPDEVTETTWRRSFDENEPVHAIVAEIEGRLVGFTHYLFHRSTTSIGPNCYLQDLFVLEEARGRGVASALIDAVGRAAKEQGAQRVYWQTHENNQRARALYDRIAERSGFLIYRITL